MTKEMNFGVRGGRQMRALAPASADLHIVSNLNVMSNARLNDEVGQAVRHLF
jgi:hypothetical protein